MSAASFHHSSFLQVINAVMLWPVPVEKVPQAPEHLKTSEGISSRGRPVLLGEKYCKQRLGRDHDNKARVGRTLAVFKTFLPNWISAAVSVKTKLGIFRSDVKFVLFYTCETWCTTKSSVHKLQTFVNRCLLCILHIKQQDRVIKEEVWRRAETGLSWL